MRYIKYAWREIMKRCVAVVKIRMRRAQQFVNLLKICIQKYIRAWSILWRMRKLTDHTVSLHTY